MLALGQQVTEPLIGVVDSGKSGELADRPGLPTEAGGVNPPGVRVGAGMSDRLGRLSFARQAEIETEALALFNEDPARAMAFLTEYSNGWANSAVERYWKLGDELWVRYNNLF